MVFGNYNTSGEDYYGGDKDENTILFEGKRLYPVVDETTGVTQWYERKGALRDIKLGESKPGGKFEIHDPLLDAGFFEVFDEQQRKKFLSDGFQKQLRKKAEEVVRRENVEEKGDEPGAAANRAKELLDTGEMTTPPDADAADVTSQGLDDLPMEENKKTRREFGDFRYPIDMDPNQDVMKFTMLKYETKDLMTDGSFGFGNRDRVGPEGGARATGTVVLPIQSGIKDQNAADWGDNKMNAVDAAKASVALGLLGDDNESNAIEKVAGAIGSNSAAAKEGIKQLFAAKAAGVTGLLQRTRGATINPNLELLFNEPTLRPFSFSFKLSARSKKEAETIVKIIRFFKQGMAPIRTESNLFLLAPHTFQIHYLLRGAGEHPFIGKMKECALLNMTTDYTPENNYSTLKDGFMTSYTITMEFKELEPIFNDDYESDTKQQFASFREDPAENAALQEDFANGSANDPLPADIGF